MKLRRQFLLHTDVQMECVSKLAFPCQVSEEILSFTNIRAGMGVNMDVGFVMMGAYHPLVYIRKMLA